MAQDYWRGGWANALDMSHLPGSQGAAVSRGHYGPLNALADILGAYWQKDANDKANKAVDEYEASFDSNMAPAPQLPAPTVMDGLMAKQGLQEAPAPQAMPQTKPLSWQEYSTKAKAQQSKLLRELSRKYGLANMREIVQHVQDVTNDKINAYGRQRMDELSPQVFKGGLSQMSMPEWYKTAMEYKQIADSLGMPFDPAQFLSTQAMKIGNVDAGGQIIQQAAPANGLPIGYDGNGNAVYTQRAGVVPKSMTPYQIQQAKQAAANQRWKQYNDDRTFDQKERYNKASLGLRAKDVDSNVAYREWKINNGGGSGKMSDKEAGALQGIKDLIAAVDQETDAKKSRQLLDNLENSIEEAIEHGYIKGDDVPFFRGIWRGKRGEHYKRNAQNPEYENAEDNAAMEFSQVPPDVWQEVYEPIYGKQPYN